MKKSCRLITTILLVLSLASNAMAATSVQSCDYMTDENITENNIKNGKDAYCAFRVIALDENNSTAFTRIAAGFFAMSWGGKLGEVADAKHKASRKIYDAAYRYQDPSGQRYLMDTAEKLKRGSSGIGALAIIVGGIFLIWDGFRYWDSANPTRTLKIVIDSFIEGFVPSVADSTLGPVYVSSPEKLAEFFEQSESQGFSTIEGSPVLEEFMYASWQKYQEAKAISEKE